MIPLRDNIVPRTTPVINYLLIAACGIVFLMQLRDDRLVEQFGMIPKRVIQPNARIEIKERVARRVEPGVEEIVERSRLAEPAGVPAWLTPLTCIFLHGGWLHIIGNLWFLHIFGDNVEDRFGHFGFLSLYVGCGIAASLAHLAANPDSTVPTIGASGAIAGVMGAYLVLYPRAQVLSLVPIFIIFFMVVLPAPVFLGVWFLIQFFEGTAAIRAADQTGVAWWAHIGGFLVGAGVALLLKLSDYLNPPAEYGRASAERSGIYRLPIR